MKKKLKELLARADEQSKKAKAFQEETEEYIKYLDELLEDEEENILKTYPIKKPTYKDLANKLGVTEQAVKQYPKDKRDLMLYGLWEIKKLENKVNN